MKQDIRNLFRDKEGESLETLGNQLPNNHRQAFYDKLKASRPRRHSKLNTNYFFKVAAIMILFIAFTVFMFKKTEKANHKFVEESPIEIQIDAIEKHYLASIDKEWQKFINIANDDNLVIRYKNKLDDLDIDYKEISKQFKTDNNNILVIESLVENLQTRLQLLKDIQEHINVLNQKTEPYETINI